MDELNDTVVVSDDLPSVNTEVTHYKWTHSVQSTGEMRWPDWGQLEEKVEEECPGSRRFFCGCFPLPRLRLFRRVKKSGQDPDVHGQGSAGYSSRQEVVVGPREGEVSKGAARRGWRALRRGRHPEQASTSGKA